MEDISFLIDGQRQKMRSQAPVKVVENEYSAIEAPGMNIDTGLTVRRLS